MRSYFEAIWQDLAAYQMAGMGHVPFRTVAFDPESDVTLLELPSSELMGWSFGDVDNLVLSIKRTTLAAGRFTGLKVSVELSIWGVGPLWPRSRRWSRSASRQKRTLIVPDEAPAELGGRDTSTFADLPDAPADVGSVISTGSPAPTVPPYRRRQ